VTLAGLPPTLGFVSEWFLLEALLQHFRLPHLPYAVSFATAGALVSLTAGFASVTFVRVVGLVALGPRAAALPGRAGCRADLGAAGRAGVLLLGAGGFAVAALTPLQIRVLATGLADLAPRTGAARLSPWVVQPAWPGFSSLSPSWLWLVMPAFAAGVLVLLTAASRGGAWRVRRTPAWRSASGGVSGTGQYTPFGFANPTRRVLSGVLRTRVRTVPAGADGPGGAGPAGASAGVSAGGGGGVGPVPAATAGALGWSSDVVDVIETYLYRSLLRPARAVVAAAKRLQSGRLDAYLTYMLVALVALLALVAALAGPS
jgi:hypothetical protein